MGIEVESWKMYFDGATNQNGSRIGVLLISPKGTHIPLFGRLNFPATEVYGDSALICFRFRIDGRSRKKD